MMKPIGFLLIQMGGLILTLGFEDKRVRQFYAVFWIGFWVSYLIFPVIHD